MKINAVISKPNISPLKSDKTAIFSAIIIVIGIIVGVVLYFYSDSKILDSLCDYFFTFTSDFSNKNKPEILSGIIIVNIPYFFIMLFLGTSTIGGAISLLITAFKSIGISFLTTYIYHNFTLKGIEYCLLILFPGKFLLILAMLMLTKNSLETSMKIYRKIHLNQDSEIRFDKYILRSAVIFLIIILSAFIDFFTMTCFSALFDFTS